MSGKICVYAICKNEIALVDGWLENMSEADYIVVLDTGSTDGTFEKLQQDKRVTRVEQAEIKPWRFDVARNKSLELVPNDADLLVCTDFDERFESGWATAVRDVWDPEKYNRIFYNYAWSHNDVGEPTDVFKYDKMHTRDFHWVFPVHEVLWPISATNNLEMPAGAIKAVDISEKVMLHHYQNKEKERKYYFDLLKLAVEEDPDNPHENMLLAREYLLAGKVEEALREYKNTLNSKNIDLPSMRFVLLESLGRCGDCYRMLNNYDEAIWYYQEFIKEDYSYREPYFGLARCYINMQMPTLAEAVIKTGLQYSTRKYIWIEQADSWISEADYLLAIAYLQLNKINDGLKHVEIAMEHHPDNIELLKLHADLSKKFRENLKKSTT